MEDYHTHTFVRQHRESGYVLACIHPGCEEVRPELPTLDPIVQEQEQQKGEQIADDQQSQETRDGTGGQAEGAPETQTKKVVKARAEKV